MRGEGLAIGEAGQSGTIAEFDGPFRRRPKVIVFSEISEPGKEGLAIAGVRENAGLGRRPKGGEQEEKCECRDAHLSK